ncbi:hypothetical protein, partial [Acinetobacter sp. BSP-53]|uniref:hypothetical protein n=1 Tax=Acinetobacter sp. BSP-53 TaxID=3344662 RepID=UPI00376F82C7
IRDCALHNSAVGATSLERFTNILISPVKYLNEHNTRYAEIRELWTFVFLLWKLIYKRPN